MAQAGCADCKVRAKYDRDPKSLLGRLWRWHAGWCPGFTSYMRARPDDERLKLAERYNLPRYK